MLTPTELYIFLGHFLIPPEKTKQKQNKMADRERVMKSHTDENIQYISQQA